TRYHAAWPTRGGRVRNWGSWPRSRWRKASAAWWRGGTRARPPWAWRFKGTGQRMIPIAKPELGEEEAAAAREAILSGWVTQGPRVTAFEEAFAHAVGAPHACAVSNCTTALHLALHALGVGPGDEVVTVSHSFVATANVVVYCGAKPVFVDIDPRTFNID